MSYFETEADIHLRSVYSGIDGIYTLIARLPADATQSELETLRDQIRIEIEWIDHHRNKRQEALNSAARVKEHRNAVQ
jgi:hypothetical protein